MSHWVHSDEPPPSVPAELVLQKREELTELLRIASDMNHHERRTLLVRARRTANARGKYGPLNLEDDGRDFVEEVLQELYDALNYTAMAIVQRRVRG